jgi:hypothetical protein
MRWIVACLASSLLQGCMMGGMGGMGSVMPGGASEHEPGTSTTRQHIVKELVAGGVRVTADFPVFGPEDSLEYSVVLRALDGQMITTDAGIVLSVVSTTAEGRRPGESLPTRLPFTRRNDGSFVASPSIPRDGAYRLTLLVERVGATTLEQPLMLDQIIDLGARPDHAPASGPAPRRTPLSPLLLLGAGLMAVMMLLTIR